MGLKIGISGKAGVGKTTLIKRLVEKIGKEGIRIEGFYTEEVRENNERVGFIAKRVNKDKKVVLAWKGGRGSKVGKYSVFVEDFQKFCEELLEDIKRDKEEIKLIVIDEIGPMELKAGKFIKLVNYVLSENFNLIATIHKNIVKNFEKKFNEIYWLEREKFEEVFNRIVEKLKFFVF